MDDSAGAALTGDNVCSDGCHQRVDARHDSGSLPRNNHCTTHDGQLWRGARLGTDAPVRNPGSRGVVPTQGFGRIRRRSEALGELERPSTLVPYVAGGAGLYQGAFERARAETDPTAVVGAGAHLYLRRHLSIRPEGTLRFVIEGSKTHRVATVTLAVTYHFEEHGGMQ